MCFSNLLAYNQLSGQSLTSNSSHVQDCGVFGSVTSEALAAELMHTGANKLHSVPQQYPQPVNGPVCIGCTGSNAKIRKITPQLGQVGPLPTTIALTQSTI